MRIFLVSDLHITPFIDINDVVWVNNFCEFVKCSHEDNNLIIVLGDVVSRGNAEAYRVANEIFNIIKRKLCTVKHEIAFIPGNHDYCKKSTELFRELRQNYQTISINKESKTAISCVYDHFNVVLINSVQNAEHSKLGKIDLDDIKKYLIDGKKLVVFASQSIKPGYW